MYTLKITDIYEILNNCTENKNEGHKNTVKYLDLSITSSILLLCLISLTFYPILKPLFSLQVNNGGVSIPSSFTSLFYSKT